jgi:hypothetical protein
MLKWTLFIVALSVGTASLVLAGDGKQPSTEPLPWGNLDTLHWSKTSGQAGQTSKKACSVVYPVPQAAKNWTGCKSGEYSECGGPQDCTCGESDDRLIVYHCNEGSYSVCEDDNSCTEGS